MGYSVSWYQSVHFIGQMGLSVAGVNIGSCAVAVASHHLFCEFTHRCFIIATVIISMFYLLPFRWLVSTLFLSFQWNCQLLESLLDPVRLQQSYIIYCLVTLHVYFLVGTVSANVAMCCVCCWVATLIDTV